MHRETVNMISEKDSKGSNSREAKYKSDDDNEGQSIDRDNSTVDSSVDSADHNESEYTEPKERTSWMSSRFCKFMIYSSLIGIVYYAKYKIEQRAIIKKCNDLLYDNKLSTTTMYTCKVLAYAYTML